MEFCFTQRGRIGVGVSGGADSMVLLDLLLHSGADVVVINFEHGIRGESSVRDSRFVKAYCADKGIPFLGFSLDAPAEAEKNGISLELAARKLRYEVFDRLLSDGTVNTVALAHHATDNAETVLMRILRGTGIRGLVGVTEREGYVRPLLKATKAEILAYAQENSIPYVEDETNALSDCTRNFLRNEIFPRLRERFPNAEESFFRLSAASAEAWDYLGSQLLPYTEENGVYRLGEEIFSIPKILAKLSINEVFRAMGAVQDVEARHLEYILSLREKQANSEITLPFSVTAERGYKGLLLYKKEDYGDFCEAFSEKQAYSYAGYTYRFEKADGLCFGCFDLDKVPETAVIRTRKAGDSFKRCNGRRKSLSDFLTDGKTEKQCRDRLLVLADESEILAVLGIEISDKIKLTDTTVRLFKIIKN